MINRWFPGIFGSSSESTSVLKLGDPTKIQGNLPGEIQDYYQFQPNATSRQVLDAAELSGEERAREYLHTKLSRHNLAILTSRATRYKNQLAYGKEAMKIDAELQSERSQFGEAVTRYAFGSTEKQKKLDGYTSAFEEVSESFNF
jgi:hypothetical protein